MSVISQCYSVAIDLDISAPGNVKEVVDEINSIDKRNIYKLMSNVKLNNLKIDPQIHMHTNTQKNDVSIAK